MDAFKLRRWVFIALIASVAAALFASASAAPIVFPVQTTVVTLDGKALGTVLHPLSLNSLRFTITFNPNDGLFHLWVLNGGDTQNPSDMQVADITYATSADGAHFTSQGHLNPPLNWWTLIAGVGATAEPSVNFLRVDNLGGSWFLTIWSPNETNTGLYNYNANVWDVGPNISNLSIVQHGPLPSLSDAPPGPGGNMVGSFGMVNGNIYLRQDTQFNSGPPVTGTGGGIGRYTYTDGTRPTLSPLWGTSEAELFAGTPYCWPLPFAGPNQCMTFPLLKPSYVHNSGRVVAQGGNTLGAYYTFRDNSGARQDKQIWYVESADGGLTWSAPVGVYANGNAVLVGGVPNTANFSSPEITAVGARFQVYFSTGDGSGNLVVVTGPGFLANTTTNVAIPTLSVFALVVLAGLLGVIGVTARRHAQR